MEGAMDKAQAVEIQRHILQAIAALDRAHPIIFALDSVDREVFVEPFVKSAGALEWGILQEVYVLYPDLRPPDDDRHLFDTTLRWEDVVLPDSVSEADLDSIIFSFVRPRWMKTAKVLSDAYDRCLTLALPIDHQMLAARIEALGDADRLEAAGDLRKWRYSEVRLNAAEDREV
jgi:hypothetical protein